MGWCEAEWADLLVLGMTLVFLVILECAGPAGGQVVDSWHGKEVVLESPETELIVGSEVVATGKYHRVFQVKRVKGNWLLVVSGTVSGWVDRDEVISFDQAIEECNRAIEDGSNPGLACAKRGNLWFDKQDWEHALADFNEVLQRDPKNTVLCATAASYGADSRTKTRRSPIIRRQSSSTRITATRSRVAAVPGRTWGIMTARSQTTPRRCGSTRTMPWRWRAEASHC